MLYNWENEQQQDSLSLQELKFVALKPLSGNEGRKQVALFLMESIVCAWWRVLSQWDKSIDSRL